jgi:hypothetical protein
MRAVKFVFLAIAFLWGFLVGSHFPCGVCFKRRLYERKSMKYLGFLLMLSIAQPASAQTVMVTCTKSGPQTFSCPVIVGPAGPAGATGAQGPQGLPGSNGATGLTGATGPAGAPGPQGTAGAIGSQGPTGADGIAGPAGPAGAAGIAGLGIAAGGAIGAVLVKNSSADFDTRWATAIQALAAVLPQSDTSVLTPLMVMSTDMASGLGTSRPIAQQAALKAMVDALVQFGIVPVPAAPATVNDYYALALALGDAQNRYNGLQMTGITRLLATIVMNDMDQTTGIVNWTQAQTDIETMVGTWITLNLITVPNGVTASQLSSFALAIAHAVNTFNAASA